MVEPPAARDAVAISSIPDLKELPLPLPIENDELVVVPVPVVLPVVPVVPVPTNALSSPPPHALSASAIESRTVLEAKFLMIHPNSVTVRPIRVPVSRR